MSAVAPTRVVVTGGTGLLGGYLLNALAPDARFDVVATRRVNSDLRLVQHLAEHVDWRVGELEDIDFARSCMAGADALVHAAGLVSYDPRARAALRHHNVELTALLTHVAQELGVAHFLFVSSIATLSPALRDQQLIDERGLTFHVHADTSRYALSKYEAEREVWRASEEGLGMTILNPSVVLGSGRWRESSAQLIDWVAQQHRFYPQGGTGFVDARDVAAFAKTCLLQGPRQARFIVSAENWTYGEFFAAVAKTLQVAPPPREATAWQAEAAWRLSRLKAHLAGGPPLLTRESARRAMQLTRYDNAASLAAGASYRPLLQTIEDVAQAYRTRPSPDFSPLLPASADA